MGGILSFLAQSFPPRPTWSADDIPDLTGKVILVTGAPFLRQKSMPGVLNVGVSRVGGNTGVGKETVKVRAPNVPPCLEGSLNPEP